MLTENEIKIKGMQILAQKMGKVEAERFISLLLREPFDYTKWQKKLFADLTVEEISHLAMKNRNKDTNLLADG